MTKLDSVQVWQERDTKFERRFELTNSLKLRHLLGKLFGQNRPPNLNEYRDHLIEGNAVGALPVEGVPQMQEFLERLAAEDHEQRARAQGEYGMQTEFVRRGIAKIAMDLQAGKISLFGEKGDE